MWLPGMKIKKTDTIRDICPIYDDLEHDEKLSIFYYFLVLINDGDYEITEMVFNALVIVGYALIDLTG